VTKAERERLERQSPLFFATSRLSIPEGWDWESRPYLEDVYDDLSKAIVIEKATQVGISTLAVAKVLHGLKFRYTLGAIYYLPTFSEMGDFEKFKVREMTRTDPELKPQDVQTEVENTRMKRIGKSFLYLRGTQNESGVRSVPVDCVVLDEMDHIEPRIRKMALDRLGSSTLKEVIELSRPTVPNFGIDARFQESDQRYWLLTCPGCSKSVCLEETFPECVSEQGWLQCPACHHQLDARQGEWVPKYPDRTLRGYHFSQLISPTVDLQELLRDYRTTRYLDVFYNSRLGLPYVEVESRLDKAMVLTFCSQEPLMDRSETPCTMGVDQGMDLHVVISRPEGSRRRIVYLGILKEWRELDDLMYRFKVKKSVVDALPEQRNARDFCRRHRGKAFMSFYNEHRKGDVAWDDVEGIVQSDRTESLDEAFRRIRLGQVILPKFHPLVDRFAEHLTMTAKKLEEDDKGNARYVYVRLGDDHFAHAWNYDCLCWTLDRTEVPIALGKRSSGKVYSEELAQYERSVF